jgi:AcrR family transcriptional regulator
MAANVKPRRAYDASRRREQARESRRAMLDAGRRLFLEHGYANTTIAMVAEKAGVSVQTVYKAFDNKPGLVKALVDVALVGDDEPVPMMEREFVQQNMAEPDPRKKLLDYGVHVAEIAPRAQPILLVIRDAGAVDAGAAEVWERLQAERLTGMTHFAQHMKSEGHLRRGVSVSEARDVLWAHNSVELWDLLVRQRGWAPARYGRWIGNQLIAALL